VSSEASNAIVNVLGVPTTLSSEYGTPIITITRPNGAVVSFAVDVACSGVYSLIGFLIFALFIAYIIREKTWKKLVLFFVGFPLIYLLNIIRLTAILLIGYHLGEETALQTFHLLGGWMLIFLGTLLLLFVSEKIFKMQIFAKPAEKCLKCNPKNVTKQSFCHTCGRILEPRSAKLSRSGVMKIVAVVVSIVLLMSIQAPVFALTQSPATVIITTPSGQQVSTEILPEISGYELDFIYRDTNFEARAKQDMAIQYRYSPIDQLSEPIWVTIEIASTRSSLHAWEACLINYPIRQGDQPRVSKIELKDVQLVENPPIFGRYFVFQYTKTNETQAVLYWVEAATFAVNSTSKQKFAKISVIALPDSLENPTSLENQLQVFATAIANYWQPIKTWSYVALLLSQNGDKLMMLTTAMLAGIVVFYVFITRKKGKATLRTYEKLPKSSRQIVDVTHETEKKSISTLNNIALGCQNMTGQPLDKEQLLHELSAIEKARILQSVVTNRNDEPILVWKTHMTF
jgi:exosortase/archaeosortase family protein